MCPKSKKVQVFYILLTDKYLSVEFISHNIKYYITRKLVLSIKRWLRNSISKHYKLKRKSISTKQNLQITLFCTFCTTDRSWLP